MKNMEKKILFILLLMLGISSIAFGYNVDPNIKNITAISEVFGDGQKVSAVILEYDSSINSSKLKTSNFKVEGKTITKVYSNTKAEKSANGVNGKYVVIELATPIENISNFGQMGENKNKETGVSAGGPQLGDKRNTPPEIKTMEALVTQLEPIVTVDNKKYIPSGINLKSSKTINLVVDDFKQLVYTDSKYSNEKLMYNLYTPKNYNPAKKYPLVVFMHDAGAVSDIPNYTLIQGNGATVWATPEAQAQNECFVLAPQYDTVIANDKSETSNYMDITIDLIKDLQKQYSIDTNRVYNTGQSMGGMTSIAMNIKYPDVFAASLLVACKWDATKVAPLANKNLWIIVSEGAKEMEIMDAIVSELKKYGLTESKASWNAEASTSELAQNVNEMISKNANINYTTFKGGNHRYTWIYGYSIEGIRNWLFKQVKSN